ncbi:hypothetical protein B0T26DRAFT_213690 [Lasiosphaeria miniovina]|uniref:LRR-containing protein second PH domain-containing protein n=1 Tax=Lasiosphaeria miniovina TaxID=1954250 RepID=A0AA40AUN2_9PEZI|nr:uncharacterized protein B0T26DRAFT_213690 [Lasiosphaeria miniovina]KAK0722335.1 hypothetical protein B0T26DRAFT_213690 [Lasiosphaeria miniovina]
MPVPIATMDLRRKKVTRLMPLTMAASPVSDATLPSPAVSTPGSPTSSEGGDRHHTRSFSLHSLKDRGWRPFGSRESISESVTIGSGSLVRGTSSHSRRLSKSRPHSASPFDSLNRRSSGFSDDFGRLSLVDTMSTTSSSMIDWASQNIMGSAALERDTQLLRSKNPYLVVTTDYLMKLKSHADVLGAFPPRNSEEGAGATQPEGVAAASTAPEPAVLIPVASIVSVFPAETTRPSFGIEVWWRSPSGFSFQHTVFCFNLPAERNEQMHNILRAMREESNSADYDSATRHSPDLLVLLRAVQEAEEPLFKHQKLEIFPVAPRGLTRMECNPKAEEASSSKKSQEGPAIYLVVGTYLCYLIEIQKGAKGGEPFSRHRKFGILTLENLRGDWTLHQERFNMTFRDPFRSPVTLELASRYYRHIIRIFGTADRFLKPVWPQLWQTLEVHHISGLKEPQYLVPRDDFGSIKRTLDAYLAAYHCDVVDWEINWKSKYAPEFRLLPPKNAAHYSPLQLLAVLRALRYNDYFNSLSFRDINLAVLWGVEDSYVSKFQLIKPSNVAYLNRTCVTLDPDEVEVVKRSSLLHQEFHALAFCSENIRQIDFTNSSASLSSYLARPANYNTANLQYLTPILTLLKSGLTRCNRFNLSGNTLHRSDIQDLAESLKTGSIQALDVSCCGLDDMALRDLIVGPFLEDPQTLQSLNLSGNPGRLPARLLHRILMNLTRIKELNLGGSIQGNIDGALIPYETLICLDLLEELDISNFKHNDATMLDLERFLRYRSQKMDDQEPLPFRKLVLNHCGITGKQAARLFDAIGEDHGLQLFINGNPIEEGLEGLTGVIRLGRGPIGLNMEMVEFKTESQYLALIQALTETKHLNFLSLVGTAPTFPHQGPCSQQMIRAFEEFFSRNRSIRFLDLSGFCGKLEDGQLAKGFGHSLIGLIKNQTMTHLRIRNQDLHEDAGTIGRVLSYNRHLVVLDCQDNNFNLTSLQFLVESLKNNNTIVDFPFSAAERESIWQNILRGLQRRAPAHRRSSSATVAKGSANNNSGGKDQFKMEESMLRAVFERQFEDIDMHVRRNRKLLEGASGLALDMLFDSSTDSVPTTAILGRGTDYAEGWPSIPILEELLSGSTSKRKTKERAGSEVASRPTYNLGGDGVGDGDGDGDRNTPTAPDITCDKRRPTIHSSTMAAASSPPVPYHVLQHHDGIESPTETLDPASEISTPPEVGSPTLPGAQDQAFKQMMNEFKSSGFEC